MDGVDYDIIICGGGPAGSTCAMTFKDTNARVLVIDKTSFPREKVCGDGIAPYIPKILNRISPSFKEAFEAFPAKSSITKIFLRSYNGTSVEVELNEHFYVSTRYNFDTFLYEQANSLPNVDYANNTSIKDVKVYADYAEVQTDTRIYKAKLVIGCDGAMSAVRRALTDFKVKEEKKWATVRAYYSGVTGTDQERFEVYYSKKHPNGYFWLFPSEGGKVNIGFGTFSHLVSERKLDVKKLMLDMVAEIPELKARFAKASLEGDIKGWSIPVDFENSILSGDRFMLCGDAASLPDPATGEGIGPAMSSGRIAGFFAQKCLEKECFSDSFMKGNNQEIEKKFGSLIRKRKRVEKWFSKHNWMLDSFVSVIGASKFIRKRGEVLLGRLLS